MNNLYSITLVLLDGFLRHASFYGHAHQQYRLATNYDYHINEVKDLLNQGFF